MIQFKFIGKVDTMKPGVKVRDMIRYLNQIKLYLMSSNFKVVLVHTIIPTVS